MQQNVGSAGRPHTEKRSDDARRRHRGLENVGLKPLVEKIDRAHGHELDLVVLVLAGHVLEAASEEEHLHQFARIERCRIRRNHAQNRLHEPAHRLHRLAEFVIGFGVNPGVSGDLAMRLAVIVYAPEIVAIWHGSESAVQRKDFKAMTGQIQIADDLRPQEGHDVRAHREFKSREDFFGASGAAKYMPAL